MRPSFDADTSLWIRQNAWSRPLGRALYTDVVAAHGCGCQMSDSNPCMAKDHDTCPAADPVPTVETFVLNSRGRPVADGDGWPAAVWLVGRSCRWVCPCICHWPQAEIDAARARSRAWVRVPAPEPMQPALF